MLSSTGTSRGWRVFMNPLHKTQHVYPSATRVDDGEGRNPVTRSGVTDDVCHVTHMVPAILPSMSNNNTIPGPTVRKKALQVLAYRAQGMTFEEIAPLVGYKNGNVCVQQFHYALRRGAITKDEFV